MRKIMLVFRTVIVGLLCAVVLLGLSACAGDDPAGTALDRFLWETRGFPTQDEILDHLQEKYNEEFVILDLNSGSRFFQGVAHPANNPELAFSLEMKDEDGNSMPVQYMRDDYQARLAEQYILQRIRPIVDGAWSGTAVTDLRVEIGLFDRTDDFSLPESFDWTPADGLEVLAEKDTIAVQLMIRITLAEAALISMNEQSFVESLVNGAEIPFAGALSIARVDSDAQQLIEWTMQNGKLGDITGGEFQ